MRKRTIRIFQAAAIAAVPLTLLAFSTGPPIKRTGAPVDGGITCTACHRTFDLNDNSGGSIFIRAAAYTPGVKQRITVKVDHPDGRRFGFQLTARLVSDETKEAGTFTSDENIQVLCDPTGNAPCNGALEFAEHRQVATGAGSPGPRTFTVEWTPPATDVGQIVFYAAGNATNNSNSNAGDHIYNTKLTIPLAGIGPKPAFTSSNVQNGASYVAGFAPNGWVQIKGTNLAWNTRLWQAEDFASNKLPTALDGTGVKINGKDAFVYYISPEQVNVLAPVDDAATGNVSVQITTNGITSDAVMAPIQRLAPAFFIFKDNHIAARHADTSYVGPTTLYPGATTPAKPSEIIVLYGSGFGATSPAVPNGELVTTAAILANAFTLRMGGVEVTPEFAGLTATGLYQFNVRVPASAPDGDLPVIVTIGGVSSPSTSIIRVQR